MRAREAEHLGFPNLSSQSFDGDNPRLWHDCCNMYFEVYAVSASLKTRFAALNFKSAASAWLQIFGHHGRVLDCDSLCTAVFERLEMNQYQL